MDPNTFRQFMASAPIGLPNIGDSFKGGYYVGVISHTADGNATHALIICPIANGLGELYTGTRLSFSGSGSTSNAASFHDGALNTSILATSAGGNGGIIDAVTSLSIDGYSDWYVPAVAEMYIAYYNLKPTTHGNTSTTGAGNYAVPQRTTNFTNNPSDPAQTTLTNWQQGNGQRIKTSGPTGNAFNGRLHWTSTRFNNTSLKRIDPRNGQVYGQSITNNKSACRAFRKVAL